MAAKTLSTPTTATPQVVDRFTGDATANNLRQVDVASATRSLTLRVVTSAGAPMAFRVAHTGTDGAAIGTDYFRLEAGETYAWSVHGTSRQLGGWSLFVAGESADPTIEVISNLHAGA